MRAFFSNSALLGRLTLRPLSRIRDNWELTCDADSHRYNPEEQSYAGMLNQLIEELGQAVVPARYHDNEDCLAEYVRSNLGWNIQKIGGRWVGDDYAVVLEQGGYHDINEQNLLLAAAGRIRVAISRDQRRFDDMEQSHQRMLASIIAIILYHRTDRCNAHEGREE
jgi:hypothetical protein